MIKTIEPSTDVIIRFTEDELAELNLSSGDRLEFVPFENGFKIKKCEKIELELNDLSREQLELLVVKFLEADVPAQDVFRNIIEDYINSEEND